MTFLGVPARALADVRGGIVVLGARHAVPYPGQEQHAADAPTTLRAASQRAARFVGNWDFDLRAPLQLPPGLVDAGDIATRPDDPDGNTAAIRRAVRQVLASGALPIVLGGGDSVPAPVIAAHDVLGRMTVLHLDAHLDFRDEVEGVRDGYSSGMRRASEMPWVTRIVHAGLRGVGSAGPHDVRDSERAGDLLVTASDIERAGVEAVVGSLKPARPSSSPSTATYSIPPWSEPVRAPVPDGLGYRQVLQLLLAASARGKLSGLVLTEYAPALDTDEGSALVLVRLLAAVLSGQGAQAGTS